MLREDEIRLRHILDAAGQAKDFLKEQNCQDLSNDLQLQFALVRCLEIIGEAASKVSDSIQNEYPQVPWNQMRGMRNRLIHAYFDIDVKLVWGTITDDIPPLIEQITGILSST